MASNKNSGLGHGSGGAPQSSIEEMYYEMEVDEIERTAELENPPFMHLHLSTMKNAAGEALIQLNLNWKGRNCLMRGFGMEGKLTT